ncbi:MAG: hypothetical protein ACYDBB_25455 [Armatimonadota bacterium]
MTYETFTQMCDIWITQYSAGFCLVSILLWALITYLKAEHWERTVRDCAVYFLLIGTPALLLAMRPQHPDFFLWSPLSWFSFSMLIVLELLWLSFMIDTILRTIQDIVARNQQQMREAPNPPLNYYHR